jgi:HD-GYP domain-containing protein (c-di-GMP phosphodiesterase class II)
MALATIAGDVPVLDQLRALHEEVRAGRPGLDRIAIAVFDRDNDRLRTFAHSTVDANPLELYERPFQSVPSLVEVATARSLRVIDDLRALPDSGSEHTRRLLAADFRSSATLPVVAGPELYGFVFLDSRRVGYFTDGNLRQLEPAIRAASLLVRHALSAAHILRTAVRMVRELSQARDWETGNHLRRMARYSKLIAAALGPTHGFGDERVEFVFLFAPLHDLGKVGVPDSILLKQGPLSETERRSMRHHVEIGAGVVDILLEDALLHDLPHIGMLRNIVRHHHEAVDGSGYPDRLCGDDIPAEARVVAVADVFDALTTERPYKAAWSVDEAMGLLARGAGTLFDANCVDALVASRDEVEEAMIRFRDLEPLPVSEEAFALS